jgi:hypothetical protein
MSLFEKPPELQKYQQAVPRTDSIEEIWRNANFGGSVLMSDILSLSKVEPALQNNLK